MMQSVRLSLRRQNKRQIIREGLLVTVRRRALQTDTIAATTIHPQRDPFAPAFVVQVSHGAVHQLIGRPLQGHDVGVLVQREVTRHGLHVIPLNTNNKDGGFFIWYYFQRVSYLHIRVIKRTQTVTGCTSTLFLPNSSVTLLF